MHYLQMHASGYLWPVVELHLKYVRPAYDGQRIKARATSWSTRIA